MGPLGVDVRWELVRIKTRHSYSGVASAQGDQLDQKKSAY